MRHVLLPSALVCALLLTACGDDTAPPTDTGPGKPDAPKVVDQGVTEGGSALEAGTPDGAKLDQGTVVDDQGSQEGGTQDVGVVVEGGPVEPDGSTTTPDGSTTTPDGSTTTPDGSTTTPDGSTTTADGSTTTPDGSTTTPDGSTTTPDGSTTTPDGSTVSDTGVDAPKDAGVDAPQDAAVDAPQQLDGPVVDAPQQLDAPMTDGYVPPDAPVVLPDGVAPYLDGAALVDGAVASDTNVVGQNDAGQYLCATAGGGSMVCQCNDGLENDTDGLIDYPNDPGCTAPFDNSEIDGTTQCTDGIDNDGDGKVDAYDPECTGPLDDDEGSFGAGIPGDNTPCGQDCFFDGNSGSGDDDCAWNLKCDPLEPANHLYPPQSGCLPYDPGMLGGKKCPWPTSSCTSYCGQSATCLGFCKPITPNGCDCFGCCQIPVAGADAGATTTILLRDTCKASADGTIDPTQDSDGDGKLDCPPCTQVPDCLNTCGKCEVCIGKPAPDPSCFPQPTPDAGGPVLDDAGQPTTDGWIPTDSGWVPANDAGPVDAAPAGDGGFQSPCPTGVLYCGPGGIDPAMCPPSTYCITGCCIVVDGT